MSEIVRISATIPPDVQHQVPGEIQGFPFLVLRMIYIGYIASISFILIPTLSCAYLA